MHANDTFHGKFESIKPGDKIGFVCGPGEFPQDNVGQAYGKGANRWGRWIRVKMSDYSFKTISGFTERGIGAYLLK